MKDKTYTTLCSLILQISDITIEGETREKRSAKDALLLWCQSKTVGSVPSPMFSEFISAESTPVLSEIVIYDSKSKI